MKKVWSFGNISCLSGGALALFVGEVVHGRQSGSQARMHDWKIERRVNTKISMTIFPWKYALRCIVRLGVS